IPVGDRLEETYTSNNQEVTAELGAPLFTTQVTGNEMSRFGATGADLIGMSHVLVNHNDTHKQASKKFSTYKDTSNAGYYMYKNRAAFFTMQAAAGGTVYVYTLGAAGSMYDSWTKKELNVGSAPEGYDSWAAVPDGTILEGDQSDVLVRNQYFTASEMTATPYTHVYSRKFNAGDVVSIPTIGQDSYNIVMVLIDWNPLGEDEKSSNANLTSLGYKVNGGEVNALTVQDSQAVMVPNDTETVELSFTAEDSKAQGAVQNPAGAVSIGSDPVTITVTVTAEDGSTKSYTVTFEKEAVAAMPDATGIKVNGTALTSFDKNRLEYDAQVEYGTESATVEVTAEDGVEVTYAPSQTINPTEVDTVTATLRAENGATKEYKIHVRPITIESSDARKAYMNGNHDTGDNKIVLSEVLIGDTQEYTYTSNGKEYTGLLGGNVYTTRLSGDVMTRFGATGENLIGMSHILVSHRDSNKQAQKDYPDTYKQSGNAGAYMYKSKSDHFYFTAGVSGTMYIYTVNAGGERFNNWSKKTLDTTVPAGYDSWADVPADTVLTGNQGDMMVQNEYLVANAINCKTYTNVYMQSFKAGDKVSVPTIGQDSYESVKVLIKWDPLGEDGKSSNANLVSLGYKVNGGSEVKALTVQDSQTVKVERDTETVELSFTAEDSKAQGAVQNPAGAVSIGDKPVTITVTVTAEDGSTKSYTVTFEKEAVAAMPDATGISVNGTALTSFHKDRLEYDAQ
ncbi:hypothetical protein INF28_12560, partial [Oscillospiraceae bacterium DSM 107454]|nr:hypothetical protein [Ructibacterium gallinarum]